MKRKQELFHNDFSENVYFNPCKGACFSELRLLMEELSLKNGIG